MESSNTGGSKNDTEIDGVGDGDNFGEPGADPKTQNFTEGEKVLAYHGPCLYEAKVQKAEQREDEWRYFVHYQGWSKNWDEWMDTDRLLKVTEENVRMQHALAKKQKTEKGSKAAKSMQNRPKSSNDAKLEKEEPKNPGVKGKKRKGQYGPEEKELKSVDKFTLLQFPLTLKKQLVDDWQFVTQLGKLVKLPRSPNVDEILKKYLEYRTKKDNGVTDSVTEILKGLRCYFDKALLAMLLYKKERQQYHDAVGDKISPSTIYGAEHLLRLFVKLPELLACVNMEEEAHAKLQQKLLDFLKFLQKNQSAFFLSSYDGSLDVDEVDE